MSEFYIGPKPATSGRVADDWKPPEEDSDGWTKVASAANGKKMSSERLLVETIKKQTEDIARLTASVKSCFDSKCGAEIARLKETLSYLPTVPTAPYEKELAKTLLERDAEIALLKSAEQMRGAGSVAEIERLRSENNKLATAHPELTRNDHRTFGDLMLKLTERDQIITRLAEALEYCAEPNGLLEKRRTAKDALADLKKWRGGE